MSVWHVGFRPQVEESASNWTELSMPFSRPRNAPAGVICTRVPWSSHTIVVVDLRDASTAALPVSTIADSGRTLVLHYLLLYGGERRETDLAGPPAALPPAVLPPAVLQRLTGASLRPFPPDLVCTTKHVNNNRPVTRLSLYRPASPSTALPMLIDTGQPHGSHGYYPS